jgi:hypothetical protein
MADDLIPGDVKQFILENIDSVAQLEGLLLLWNNSEVDWNAEEIAKRLYIDQAQAADIVTHLCARELFINQATGSPTYRYQPASSELRQKVDRLAEAYSKYLVPITNLIHSKAQTRVQQFADAFKLRNRRKK